jgi:hypothetical protein
VEVAVPQQDENDDPAVENSTSRQVVHDWIRRRVAADEQMRWAGAARKAREHAREENG